MKGIGILAGNHQGCIDHLVPLCHLMQIPILVTEPVNKELIELYYPDQAVILAQPEDYILDPYLEDYDLFFFVHYSRLGHGAFKFDDYLCRKKARSVMSLHGNPDKYWDDFWLENLMDEDIVLAYGPQLLRLLEEKGVNKKTIRCGNYRLEYYKAHETFFDAKVPFQKQKETVLYAPTWYSSNQHLTYSHQSSSIFDVYKDVFETLSERYQLIVKLHPLINHMMPDEVFQMKEAYPQIYFLDNFPLIYPLLKQIDIYIGDYSSVGYDFLYFDRPLYFLETQIPTALQNYGRKIERKDLKKLESQIFKRKELYSHVFGSQVKLSQLKQEIENAYRSDSK
ncbi:MAG: hypothetical protein S4CHLAM123_15370 [Chlamydiales bacterium]|nr:hypothetical protein [Chlamydiales bacterium]